MQHRLVIPALALVVTLAVVGALLLNGNALDDGSSIDQTSPPTSGSHVAQAPTRTNGARNPQDSSVGSIARG